MSKFSEFIAKQPGSEKRVGMEVDGDFSCQVCEESVDEAEYFHLERILRWTCTQGHMSYIEEFSL